MQGAIQVLGFTFTYTFVGRSWRTTTWTRRQEQLRRKRWRDVRDCRRFRRSYVSKRPSYELRGRKRWWRRWNSSRTRLSSHCLMVMYCSVTFVSHYI